MPPDRIAGRGEDPEPPLVRCPKCHKATALYEDVTIDAWRALTDRGESVLRGGHNDRGTDWEGVQRTGTVGCGECQWGGARHELERLDRDDVWRPATTVHPSQMRLSA